MAHKRAGNVQSAAGMPEEETHRSHQAFIYSCTVRRLGIVGSEREHCYLSVHCMSEFDLACSIANALVITCSTKATLCCGPDVDDRGVPWRTCFATREDGK
jgi:hypothetical protein